VRSAPLAVAQRLAGRAATGQGLSARLSARGVSIGAQCGCATVPSPEQSGGSRWVVSTEKLRWWQVRASAAPEPRRWRREGAAVACTDIDGAAAEIIAARIRAAGGRPTGIARAERGRPFSSPRGGTTAVFSGSRVLAVAVNRLWRKFNDNLLGRF
jgi:hypothetical protein